MDKRLRTGGTRAPIRGVQQRGRQSSAGRRTAGGAGEAINLYVMGYGSISPTTTTLTYINGRWSTFNVTLPATVEACYPATATLTSFTIPTNQSAGIAEADYMTTASSQQLNGTNLSLALEHRLSKVIVTITDWSDYGSTMPTVTDFRIQTKESITVSDNTVTGGGNTISVAPYNNDNTYTAIVAPGAGFTITLTVDRRSKTVTYPGTLESGNAYSFSLTLKDNELVLTPIGTLPGWSDQEQEI